MKLVIRVMSLSMSMSSFSGEESTYGYEFVHPNGMFVHILKLREYMRPGYFSDALKYQ